ncbi:hypothetical protein D3C76_909980 [compost metagenome]
MQVLELHVVRRAVGEKGLFLVGQRPDLFHRAAHIQETAVQAFTRGYQATGTDDDVVGDHRTVHDDAAHADQHPAAHGAAMQHDFVGDGHVIADQQRETVGVERPGMGDVQYAAILHAGARTDADAVHVAADHRKGPNGAVFTDLDIADHHRRAVDKSALAEQWRVILVLAKVHDRISLCC